MALQSMTALASITLQEASASVTFSGIPQNYRDLVITTSLRTNRASNTTDQIALRFNSDSGSNYPRVAMFASSGGTGSFSETSSGIFGTATAVNSVANNFSLNLIQIFDYSTTDKHKSVLIRYSVNTTDEVLAGANRWANTDAINLLTFTSVNSATFNAGSTFNLYGRIA
jgi:hypothetical protein